MAAVVGAEVARTLSKCGLAEVADRLQQLQVGGGARRLPSRCCSVAPDSRHLPAASSKSPPASSASPCPPQEQGQPAASDPALELGRVAAALRTFFARLSDPTMLPELPKLQVGHVLVLIALPVASLHCRRWCCSRVEKQQLLRFLFSHPPAAANT